MTSRVVHCQKKLYDVYIGHANPRRGLPQSPYANPFKVGKDGTREECIEKYRTWLLSKPDLVERARRELRGKVLGCWCAPKPSHGDVLVEVVDLDPDDLKAAISNTKKPNKFQSVLEDWQKQLSIVEQQISHSTSEIDRARTEVLILLYLSDKVEGKDFFESQKPRIDELKLKFDQEVLNLRHRESEKVKIENIIRWIKSTSNIE